MENVSSSGRPSPGILLGLACVTLFWVNSVMAASQLVEARVQDLNGRRIHLGFGSNEVARVFVFLSVECPISNSYAPELQRLGRDFGPKGVKLELVYPNRDETAEAVRKHLKEFGLPFSALRDLHHELVKLSKANITPEVAVFLPKEGLVYHGRIDNRYAELGLARPEATEHDLRDVLTAIVNRKPVPRSTARAVGCSIGPP